MSKEFTRESDEYWSQLDKEYVRGLFEKDASHFKLKNVLQEKNLENLIAHMRDNHYSKFVPIFQELQAASLMWPGVTWHQIYMLFKDINMLYNGKFTLSSIDVIFREANVPEDLAESLANNSPQTMLRYEFIEFILRVALERYWLSMETTSPEVALDEFCLVFFGKVKTEYDRFTKLWRKVTLIEDPYITKEIESRYPQLKEGFEHLTRNQGTISLKGFLQWMDTTDLVVSDSIVWKNFTYSKLPVKEELSKETGRLP